MERIHVCVRVRPLSAFEERSGQRVAWQYNPTTIAQILPSGNISKSQYTFDHVFSPNENTETIYHNVAEDVVKSCVYGFNGCIFAYGQTSSGKTYTIRGEPSAPGIIPMATRSIFDVIEGAPEREFLLRISYMEIYNEVVKDLLVENGEPLKILDDPQKGVILPNLREGFVVNETQIMELLYEGEKRRHFGATNLNEYSSRSHTVFRMVIESRELHPEEELGDPDSPWDTAVRVSTLYLVDLAGSERTTEMTEDLRLKEGSYINKSLLTLTTVIEKLASGKREHVPFRDSKITRILKPALGGNSKTLVISTITPGHLNVEETHSTLRFATRAKKVRNKARVNEILDDKALLKRYRNEILTLKRQLADVTEGHILDDSRRKSLTKEKLAEEVGRMEQEKGKLHEKLRKLTDLIMVSSQVAAHTQEQATARRQVLVRSSSEPNLPNTLTPREAAAAVPGGEGSIPLLTTRTPRPDNRQLDDLMQFFQTVKHEWFGDGDRGDTVIPDVPSHPPKPFKLDLPPTIRTPPRRSSSASAEENVNKWAANLQSAKKRLRDHLTKLREELEDTKGRMSPRAMDSPRRIFTPRAVASASEDWQDEKRKLEEVMHTFKKQLEHEMCSKTFFEEGNAKLHLQIQSLQDKFAEEELARADLEETIERLEHENSDLREQLFGQGGPVHTTREALEEEIDSLRESLAAAETKITGVLSVVKSGIEAIGRLKYLDAASLPTMSDETRTTLYSVLSRLDLDYATY